MSQHDYSIGNQTFPLTRADINAVLQAIVSGNAGAAEPVTTFAWMDWMDTSTKLWKQRNAANTAWITKASLNLTDDRWELRTDVVQSVSSAGVTIKSSAGVTLFSINNAGLVTVTGSIAGLAAAAAKVTPVDADSITILDSAASNILKKVTWANVKATLKTYFDTLYAVYATTTSKGPVELGTEAEGDTGTDTGRVPPIDVVVSMIATHVPDLFTDNLASPNGYTTLPNGLIIQWSKISASPWVFPLEFPSACIFVGVTSDRVGSTSNGAGYANNLTTTQVNVVVGSFDAWVIAIGF